MNTPELRMILENCFSCEALERQLRGAMDADDPYEAAINAILAEDREGAALTNVLDEESAPQRAKVRSLNAKALRDSLVVEFLEPGRTLGLILWALLRDDRIGVRSLAGMLTEEILKRRTQEEELGQEEQSILEESEEDLNRFLSDLESNDLELYSEEEIDHLLDVDPLKSEEEAHKSLAQESQEPSEELTEDEVQNLLASIDENRYESDESDDVEEASPEVSFQDDVLQDDELQDETEDLDKLIAELQQDNQERQTEEESSPVKYAFEKEDWATQECDDSTINLGGIEISRSSLRQACERIFQEPVELVTDENLILQEKIVVIGRECGFRVLNGPNYQVQKSKMPIEKSGPVLVSSASIGAALSRVYGESVELAPDPRLLEQGIAVIAGMKTGIALMQHPQIRITLPDWAEGMELSPGETQPLADESVLTDLQERVAFLENILKELASEHLTEIPAPIPTPVAEPALPPEKPVAATPPLQTKPAIVTPTAETRHPLPEPDEDHLSHETIALEEIETEELEPVLIDRKEENEEDEVEFSEDLEIDEDILAALSSDDDEEEETEMRLMENHEETNEKTDHLTLDDDLDDLNLEGLDLDALTSGLDDDEEEEEGDISLKLGDESNEEPMISLGEDEDSEDELNLDDLDLSEDDLDLDGLNLGGEDSDEEELGAVGLEEENLDLDILKELDLDDKSKERPKKVFNGDFVLLLGGDEKHRRDYDKMLKELGASGEWHGRMNNMDDGEINELVEHADLIMTLSTNALADPGIMQAANYAQSMKKRYFQHHSASPNSVRKKLVQLVEEGQV